MPRRKPAIVTPVRIEEMGNQGLALVGDDCELIFSSHDITTKEMHAIAVALNGQSPLLTALHNLVTHITSGDHYDVKNPYARKEVKDALETIKAVTGFKGDWKDACDAVNDPQNAQCLTASASPRAG